MPRTSYYRTPARPPLTRWARHIDAWMREKGLSQTGAFKQLGEAVGLGPESRSAFLPYLYNKPVDPEHEKALAAIIGWPADAGEQPAAEPAPDLATALLALAHELAEARREREEYRARLDELEATVATLVERSPDGQGSGASAGHAALRA